ncbi:hypothetical protein FZI85_04165 [Mycobacterium sp. CBMA293]|uniref:hypothetical protein n=1 Tax=unclassified Mycolicibacterium TaxID=2636767 RepID=UPI0012DEDBDE|nr:MULTISPECIES: hypothetical protein [unclassified Mycolicibacterium]MUL47130.1 hypothetical protein [Mycolicibacterium sp. CBMA 360]MUL58508.1 hypothetical protein [Mycolicibacterium sp. CBMA 335]MUL73966.1 hypothetical protein [Mycolicibacterium sp. CBMA 311]MUL93391.1 hypothetical protein [Mycolicibacterium sp. CBMA 230]MUM04606.1 hypothetical protein [Mycolicibacterium sp. CBMA 213]
MSKTVIHTPGTADESDVSSDIAVPGGAHDRRNRRWINWLLVWLTVPVAGFVMVCAFGAVMGLARCADQPCRNYGPNEFWFGILAYSPPIVAVVAIAVSIFTASRKHGIWVPLGAFAVLLTDLTVLLFTFRP